MAIQFNHTILSSHDSETSAAFLYFEDPNGHLLEIITRPYGSGGWNP